MRDKQLKAEIRHLINDDLFILWCLAPNQDLDNRWNQWIKEHPDQAESLVQAKDLVCSVRLNGYSMPRIRIEALYDRIQNSLSLQKKNKKRIHLYQYAAACAVFLLLIIGTWYFRPSEKDTNLPILFAESTLDNNQKDVELILENQQKMLLENRTITRFNSQGSIFVDKKQKSIETDRPHWRNDSFKKKEPLALNALKVPKGKRASLILSDGTRIWANSETVIYFPSVFDTEKRTIYVDGEIYLKVTKNTKKPFCVKTSRMDIRVLGTTFDVRAYRKEKKHSVVLCQGSVETNDRKGCTNRISPNEMLTDDGEKKTITKVDTYNYTFWVDETFLFERKSLNVVLLQLSRYYGVKIHCDSDIRNLICSGKLILFDDIDSVLETLSESFPITYKYHDNILQIKNKL